MRDLEEKVDNNFHKLYKDMYLSNYEIETLKNYGFDYKKYNGIKELMFDLEKYLIDDYNEELENILISISEFNYYHNTNK